MRQFTRLILLAACLAMVCLQAQAQVKLQPQIDALRKDVQMQQVKIDGLSQKVKVLRSTLDQYATLEVKAITDLQNTAKSLQ